MIAYRFAEEGREGRGREGRKREGCGKKKEERGEKTQRGIWKKREGYRRRDGRKERGGKREDTKEEYYFSLPETFSTINCCCFTISLVPTTTVLDSDACISHNNTHLL